MNPRLNNLQTELKFSYKGNGKSPKIVGKKTTRFRVQPLSVSFAGRAAAPIVPATGTIGTRIGEDLELAFRVLGGVAGLQASRPFQDRDWLPAGTRADPGLGTNSKT